MTRTQGKILAIVVVVALVVLVALSACQKQPRGNVTDEIYLKCDGPCEFRYTEDETGRDVEQTGITSLSIRPPIGGN